MRIKDGDRLLLGIEVGSDFPARNVNGMLPHAPLEDKIAFARNLSLSQQNRSFTVGFHQDFIQYGALFCLTQRGQPDHILLQ
ncbi:hypothetical protein D3C81_1751940 [compost metagenome]